MFSYEKKKESIQKKRSEPSKTHGEQNKAFVVQLKKVGLNVNGETIISAAYVNDYVPKQNENNVVQLTIADIYINGTHRESATHGKYHAEVSAFNACENKILNKIGSAAKEGTVNITFEVDTKICSDCQRFFENTIYQKCLKAAGGVAERFVLQVDLVTKTGKGKKETLGRTIVTGVGSNWRNTGE